MKIFTSKNCPYFIGRSGKQSTVTAYDHLIEVEAQVSVHSVDSCYRSSIQFRYIDDLSLVENFVHHVNEHEAMMSISIRAETKAYESEVPHVRKYTKKVVRI
jgi:hypothetical protein